MERITDLMKFKMFSLIKKSEKQGIWGGRIFTFRSFSFRKKSRPVKGRRGAPFPSALGPVHLTKKKLIFSSWRF